MATLPTLTVTDAQAQRLLAVFGSPAAYKVWLRDTLIDYVVRSESSARVNAFETSEKATVDAAKADLSTISTS